MKARALPSSPRTINSGTPVLSSVMKDPGDGNWQDKVIKIGNSWNSLRRSC
jgi:hypothetical protein